VRELRLIRPDGATLRAVLGGDAPRDLVLLPGFPFDAAQWEPQLRGLADVARVLVPETRGLGGSDLGPSRTASMSDYAADVAAWMDQVGMKRATLGGLSMGGYIVFEMWRRHRDRVDALVLADTKAEEDPPEGKWARVAMGDAIRAEGMHGVTEGMLEKVLGATTRRLRPAVVERVRDMIQATKPAGAIAALDAMRERPDSVADLATIDVPTLVLVGAEDSLTPPIGARRLARAIEGAGFVEIEDAGHVSALEAPDAVTRALRRFLATPR
jgi:pimeloyl-ACP methyl ester carboxylesterase